MIQGFLKFLVSITFSVLSCLATSFSAFSMQIFFFIQGYVLQPVESYLQATLHRQKLFPFQYLRLEIVYYYHNLSCICYQLLYIKEQLAICYILLLIPFSNIINIIIISISVKSSNLSFSFLTLIWVGIFVVRFEVCVCVENYSTISYTHTHIHV